MNARRSSLDAHLPTTPDATTHGLGTYYAVLGVVAVLGVGIAGFVGLGAGLLVGGLAGTVLSVTLLLVLYALAPSIATLVARRVVLGRGTASSPAVRSGSY